MKSLFSNTSQSRFRRPTVWLLLAWLLTACTPGTPLKTANKPETVSVPELRPELRVVTSGGFAAAYNDLQGQIESELGIKLLTAYGSSSGGATDSIPLRLERGEYFDIIILSRSSLDRLTEQGYVVPDSRRDLVRSSIGMAVKKGAYKPDISTVESFLQVLENADSIGYSASASGTYLSTDLFPRMGIWDSLRSKSQRIVSERVATAVARGDVEIGFQQISEIIPIEGAEYVGPIPEELQKVTTFSAGLLVNSTSPDAASRLIQYLISVELAPQIAKTGLWPVALEIVE